MTHLANYTHVHLAYTVGLSCVCARRYEEGDKGKLVMQKPQDPIHTGVGRWAPAMQNII